MVGILTETSTTQQLTKMCVKQSHLLLICKGWSFIKQNNLWLQLKMAKLFNQVKEEKFSAMITNWEHSRYCGKSQTILFSLLPSQHRYKKFDLFYLWDICAFSIRTLAKTNIMLIGHVHWVNNWCYVISLADTSRTVISLNHLWSEPTPAWLVRKRDISRNFLNHFFSI